MGYVVACFERLQDGHEEWARCFDKLDAALAYVSAVKAREHTRGNITCTVHEIGKRVEIEEVRHEEPQPPKVSVAYRVVDKKRRS